jgi:hypothetical protein
MEAESPRPAGLRAERVHNQPNQGTSIMRHTTKLVFAALAATILMSFAVGSASARRFEVSEQGFLIRWSQLAFVAGSFRISCPVTLEGSFHSRTLSKVCGQLIGYISRAQVPIPPEERCLGGRARALTESLPWHILYVSFAGRLPNITSIRVKLINARFLVEPNIGSCLAITSTTRPAMGDISVAAGGEVSTLTALPEFQIPLTGLGCPSEGHFEGAGEVFTLITPQTRIKVKLVQ